jgi:hypothetical protein
LGVVSRKADGLSPENEGLKKFEDMKAKQGCGTKFAMCCGSLPGLVSAVGASKKSAVADASWHFPADARCSGDFSGSGRRAVVLVPSHSLQFIKDCKDAAGVSVNDILQSATAGAMRRYCEMQGDPLFEPGEESSAVFRALVAVSIPKDFGPDHDEKDKLTNNFCFCSADMPVGAATALERVDATNLQMSKLKSSMQPVMAQFIVNDLGPLLPKSVVQATARDLFACHSLVFSNMQGPAETVYIAGQKLVGAQAVFYNAIPQVLVSSYNERIFFNLTVDPEVVQNRETFTQCYFDELRELASELGVTSDLAVDVW